MTQDEKINLCKKFVEDFNTCNWKGISNSLCPAVNYVEIATKSTINGAENFLELCEVWKSVMSDIKGEVLYAHSDGDTVLLEILWEGTHSGPLQTPLGEIPSSGMFQKTNAVQIYEIVNGKIAKMRNLFDLLAMLIQFDAVQLK